MIQMLLLTAKAAMFLSFPFFVSTYRVFRAISLWSYIPCPAGETKLNQLTSGEYQSYVKEKPLDYLGRSYNVSFWFFMSSLAKSTVVY